VPGSVRLILLRWLLWLGTGLPAILSGSQAIGQAAREPFFTQAPRPFPLAEQQIWLGSLPGWLWGMLGLGAVIGWIGGMLLTAGAVEILDSRRVGPARVWRSVFDAGPRAWFAYLRVAVLALLTIALGTSVLGAVFRRLGDHAKIAGWTGWTVVLAIPLSRAALTILWIALVGAGAFWCNVILVADRRQRVRRLTTIVPRLVGRLPVRALLLHVIVGLASLVFAALVLVAWRQSAVVDPTPWIVLWAVVLLVQSFVWHWRVRACLLTWDDPRIGDLRRLPDEPWRLPSRLGSWIWAKLPRRSPSPELP
jgi:hypothetical protein